MYYTSSFGDVVSTFTRKGNYVELKNEGEKFQYRQLLVINKDGVFVKETYQQINIFWGITKTELYTYSKPFLRLPFPLQPGKKWKDSCIEYNDGDTTTITVEGRVTGFEKITTSAGAYSALRIETKISSPQDDTTYMTEWYADGVGLIKSDITLGGSGLITVFRNFLGYSRIVFNLKSVK